jgi:hypothetical protein
MSHKRGRRVLVSLIVAKRVGSMGQAGAIFEGILLLSSNSVILGFGLYLGYTKSSSS